MKNRPYLTFLTAFSLILAACTNIAQSTPRLISSFPADGTNPPIPGLIYQGMLEMKVSSISEATQMASGYAISWGGYVQSVQTWESDGRAYARMELVTPTSFFEDLLQDLSTLGKTISRQINADRPNSVGFNNGFSSVTLSLQQSGFDWPNVNLPNWRPLRTLQQAGSVTLSLMSFLLDVLIWLLVLGGPFVFLVWLGRLGYRRLQSITRKNIS